MPAYNESCSKIFVDRHDAGKQLAEALLIQKLRPSYVFGLPRGGIVIAYEVAKRIKKPLYALVVRKIGSPQNQEFGIGAIAEGNITILDDKIIRFFKIPQNRVDDVIRKENKELARRKKLYRNNKRLPQIKNKIILVVDDGVATGYTALAAIKALRKKLPKKIIFSAPICSIESFEELNRKADGVMCLYVVDNLRAIGKYYRSFSQTSDKIVLKLLSDASG